MRRHKPYKLVVIGQLDVCDRCRNLPGIDPSPPPPPPQPLPGAVETFVGAGDVGWCDVQGAELTAALLDRIDGTVFTTGDNAQLQGSRQNFLIATTRGAQKPHAAGTRQLLRLSTRLVAHNRAQ
jgi:hypothetical protein